MDIEQEQAEGGVEDDKPTTKNALSKLIAEVNIADSLEEEKLNKIGMEAKRGYENDLATRAEWEKSIEAWTKLAKQAIEPRSYPWTNASNVKYPLLSTAAMQFAARAYPSLVPSNGQVVTSSIIGKDPDGTKYERGRRVSQYMSYQVMDEMIGWEEDMDRMLIMLPIVGVMFKKTYWDSIDKKNCSKLILPRNLVVDYWATSLEKAERITEVIEMSERLIKERQMAKLFCDIDLQTPIVPMSRGMAVDTPKPPEVDDATPFTILEQHTYIDLDDDDYAEPYIVTLVKDTGKVLRIVANYDDKTMTFDKDGTLIRIKPIQYYTKFGFIPNPDGGFYDIGFGTLLGPLNESVNTLINQLVDAGTLSNLQAGFIGKGLRIKMGETRFQPGEWKTVNATGDDIKKSIFPLPTRDPIDTIIHESVHAWQHFIEYIGEEVKGNEFEAYTIAYIASTLITEYARQMGEKDPNALHAQSKRKERPRLQTRERAVQQSSGTNQSSDGTNHSPQAEQCSGDNPQG